MIEDTELLRRYAETRSEDAFSELVHRRIGLVYSVALRQTRDVHYAKDVAQAVFADLSRKASSLSRHTVLIGWLYRSAHYAAADIVRRELSRARREKEAHIMQEIMAGDDPLPEWEKARPVLDQILSELNEGDRDAILLRYFDGRPFAEIGVRLRLSENGARLRVERSLDKLHALLSRRGITSTTAALGAILAHQASAATPTGLAATVTSTAVASAAACAHPAIGLLQFMTTSKMATSVIATALMIVAIGTTIYQNKSHEAADILLAAANDKYRALHAKLREQEESIRVAEQDAALLKQRVESSRTAAAAKAAQAAKEGTAWDPAAEGKAFLSRHPEVKQALIEKQDASTNFRFGRIYKTLALTPAEIERFQALMREGSVTSVHIDGKMAALSTGTGMSASELDRGLSELFGEERRKRFAEFGRDEAARQITQEVAKALCFTDAPLTPEQADLLTKVISSSRVAKSGTQSRALDWETIVAKAPGVLMQPQLKAVDGMRAQAVWQATVNRRIKSPSK